MYVHVHALPTRSLKHVAIAVEQSYRRSLTVNLCGKPHPLISKSIYNYIMHDENYYRTRWRVTILREWFPGVRYLESILY